MAKQIPTNGASLLPGGNDSVLVKGAAGQPDYYLVLVPGCAERVSWAEAMAWAADIGARLPTLLEQTLLAAALPHEFDARRRYWSCQSFTPAPASSHARGTHLKRGDQFIFHKSFRGNARAVRFFEIK